MANAKKCDQCGDLYESPVSGTLKIDDPHLVEVRRHTGWDKPDIDAHLVLVYPHDDQILDDCRKCTVGAVRKFMQKFDIKENKGGDRFRFTPTQKGKSVLLDSVVENESSLASRFFNAYLGQDIEVTVRVL